MPIPDFQNLMLPMLQIAADGAEHRLSDAIEALAQQLGLSDADRAELLPSGIQPRIDRGGCPARPPNHAGGPSDRLYRYARLAGRR